MFFKRYLTEKEIYKAALPIVIGPSRELSLINVFISKHLDNSADLM